MTAERTVGEVMNVRRGVISDAQGVARVIGTSWVAAYDGLLPPEALHGRSHEVDVSQTAMLIEHGPPGSGVLVAEAGEGIIGASLYGPPPAETSDGVIGVLYMLYTVPNVWGSETGRRLFDGTLDAMRDGPASVLMAEVLDRNTRARSFFERQGMEDIGSEDQDWFGVPVTVVRYSLQI